MLTDLEQTIVDHLSQCLAAASRISIDEAHSPTSLKLPGVDVIVGGGKFERAAQQYKLVAQVYVIVTFQNLRSVADRRRGVYPILEAVLALVSGCSFNLKISPLRPVRLDNITEEQEAAEGKVVFQMEFETGFVVVAQADETVTDLLRVGMNYYLQDPADDNESDASDLVTLGE